MVRPVNTAVAAGSSRGIGRVAGPTGAAGQVDPRAGAGLLGVYPHRLPPAGVQPLVTVPHDPLKDHVGDHQHGTGAGACGQDRMGRLGVQQPERVVEVLAAVAVGVGEHVALMDHHPQPQPP